MVETERVPELTTVQLEREVDEVIEAAEAILEESLDTVPLLERVGRDNGRRRVVVTGMGVLSSIGNTVETLWQSLNAGLSGCSAPSFANDVASACSLVGEVRGVDLDGMSERTHSQSRFVQLGLAAAIQAIKQADVQTGAEDRDRIGVMIGTAFGGLLEHSPEPTRLLHEVLPNMATNAICSHFGLNGISSTVVATCASGTHAIGEAVEVLRRGGADIMIAGGTDAAISPAGLQEMLLLGAWAGDSGTAAGPFDLERKGFVPGEGAAVLVLETLEHALAREATILGEVSGVGCTIDAVDRLRNNPNGEAAARAIIRAIQDAGLVVSEIHAIVAHGAATRDSDDAETAAIKAACQDAARAIPISAPGSMIGHTFGASGALGSVVGLLSIREQVIPPTINLHHPDPACDLDYVPNVARSATIRNVLLNSFGFGGNNACLVFSQYEHAV